MKTENNQTNTSKRAEGGQKDGLFTRNGASFMLPFFCITACFALWGFANDVTSPMVKAFSKIFRMSVTEGALVQVAFYLGYFVMAFPAAMFIRHYSFKAGVLVGLSLYAAGALLFFPAQAIGLYAPFLLAYFVMTCGLSFLETSCNPYIYCMGSEETATRRLNLAQAFNPIGALLGMYVAMAFVQARMNPMPTDERMQQVAETVSPMLTEYSMYVSLNGPLFRKVKAVYDHKDSLGLDRDQMKLLENSYRSFTRNGAALPEADKQTYGKYAEELSLLTLAFGNNVLRSSNAFFLHVTDPADLAGLPDYVTGAGAAEAKERGLDGWVFTLDYPSYAPFMKFSGNRELRKRMYLAYSSKGIGGETDNTGNVRKIIDLRMKMSVLLGYRTYADYALEENMAKTPAAVGDFLSRLMERSLPFARAEVSRISEYAAAHGFEGDRIMPWDFSFWTERYKEAEFSLNEELLKPYFRLENCIAAVFDLAGRLYGIRFEEVSGIPVYHKDVKVYEVTDADGRHLALFYADFFPREGKRGGAWMTEFRGQSIRNGVEERPFVSIVTNFTKPADNMPSLLTHDEFTTLLHEFGHALHGILAEGRYPSLTGTSVARDFVVLPSQIMENWAFEPE